MSPIVASVLRSVVLPAALAGAFLVAAGSRPEKLKAKIQAWILAVAFVFGAYMLLDRLNFPPADASESLSFIALLLGLFVSVSPKDVSARYGMRAVFTLIMGALLLFHIRGSLHTQVAMRNMLAFFCLALGAWSIIERSARQVSLPAFILLPLISGTATSLLLLFSASASYAQLVGVICGLLGACLVIAVVMPARLSAFGISPFVSVFLIMFMVAGHFYLDVNPWRFIILCWPFALLWVRAWLPVPKQPLVEAAVLGVLAAAPLAYYLMEIFKVSGPLF